MVGIPTFGLMVRVEGAEVLLGLLNSGSKHVGPLAIEHAAKTYDSVTPISFKHALGGVHC